MNCLSNSSKLFILLIATLSLTIIGYQGVSAMNTQNYLQRYQALQKQSPYELPTQENELSSAAKQAREAVWNIGQTCQMQNVIDTLPLYLQALMQAKELGVTPYTIICRLPVAASADRINIRGLQSLLNYFLGSLFAAISRNDAKLPFLDQLSLDEDQKVDLIAFCLCIMPELHYSCCEDPIKLIVMAWGANPSARPFLKRVLLSIYGYLRSNYGHGPKLDKDLHCVILLAEFLKSIIVLSYEEIVESNFMKKGIAYVCEEGNLYALNLLNRQATVSRDDVSQLFALFNCFECIPEMILFSKPSSLLEARIHGSLQQLVEFFYCFNMVLQKFPFHIGSNQVDQNFYKNLVKQSNCVITKFYLPPASNEDTAPINYAKIKGGIQQHVLNDIQIQQAKISENLSNCYNESLLHNKQIHDFYNGYLDVINEKTFRQYVVESGYTIKQPYDRQDPEAGLQFLAKYKTPYGIVLKNGDSFCQTVRQTIDYDVYSGKNAPEPKADPQKK